jgi:acetyl-CoA synthetase
MSESDKEKQKKYYPLPELSKNARIKDMNMYKKMWEESVKDPEKFWAKEAERIDWIKPYKKVWTGKTKGDFIGKWFEGGKLNITYNCVDRWVKKGYGNQIALIWMGENDVVKKYTYSMLKDEVSKAANALKSLGIKKGDRVCIWLQWLMHYQ